MNDKNRPRGRAEGSSRGGAESSPRGRAEGSSRGRAEGSGAPSRQPRRPSQLSAESLLELADELEENARALLRQVRQLQRMAGELGSPGDSRPPRGRPPAREGTGSRPRPQERDRERESRGSRTDKRSGDAPSWAPPGKKRRS